MYISSKDNPLIKLTKKLQQKKYRDETQLFLLEGERSVNEGLQAERITEVLLRESTAVKQSALIMPPFEAQHCHVVADKVFQGLAETDSPPPVIAIARQSREEAWQRVIKAKRLVYLDHLQDPGNVGTIIRSALAFSADGLLLSPGSADPYNAKSVRASCGAILHLPIVPEVSLDRLADLGQQGFRLVATEASASRAYYEYDFTGRQIILIGSEAFGLTQELKEISSDAIKIPINERSESLNAAISCAIILAEAKQQSFKS